jgi:hypothetical protein
MYIHEPRSNPKVFLAFTHTKKVYIGSFIKARIRIRVRPKRSGSDRIRIWIHNTAYPIKPSACLLMFKNPIKKNLKTLATHAPVPEK